MSSKLRTVIRIYLQLNMAHLKVQLSKKTIHRKQSARMKNWQQVCRSQYLIPNRYSALCWRPVSDACADMGQL